MPYRPPSHTSEHAKHYDIARKDDHDFYSSRPWRKLRPFIIRRDVVCTICDTNLSTIVDHVIERAVCPERSLDPSNLRGVCTGCHNRRHKKKDGTGDTSNIQVC